MESHVYNVSEALICFVPVFFIISLVGGALLWNSWPSKKTVKNEEGEVNDNSK